MADASVFGKPVNKYKQTMAGIEEGANRSGTLTGMAPTSNRPVHVNDLPDQAVQPEQGIIGQIDDSAAAVAAQNALNPSIQDKLAKIAAARAKFYGEGAAPEVAPAPAAPVGQVYPAMQPKGRR